MAYGFNPNALLDTFSPTALKDRVAIITGGGTGIGRGIALEMARVGARVVVCARNLDRLEHTAEQVRSLGRRSLAIQCDVRDTDQIQQVVDRTLAEFGRIDILVNNAAGRFNIPSEDLTYNGWHAVVNTVLHGTWYFSQAAGKQMIQQGGGNIINIVATSAWLGSAEVIHSAASKAAVWNLTKTLGAEWGKYNIRVNCIVPSAVTEWTQSQSTPEQQERRARNAPLGRAGTVQEVGWMAIFLASDAASYITGECLDGSGAGWLGRRRTGRWGD
ncbi:MAG: SDR family oxidoreductase [Chloroflexi bacterium]|nr:SDR family oxidoreductase [Chloroflexota bacterium]